MFRYALGVIAVVAGLWYLETGAQVVVNNTGGQKVGSTDYVWMTPLGGLAIKMTAGETVVEGNIVTHSTTADRTVLLPPYNNADARQAPVGVCYSAATPGQDVWVVVGGFANVLPIAGVTATRGYYIYSSDDDAGSAGRAEQDSPPGAAATVNHNGEVGHWTKNGTGNGALTLAIIHFN
jgi:hypothetical protein